MASAHLHKISNVTAHEKVYTRCKNNVLFLNYTALVGTYTWAGWATDSRA